MITLWLRGLLRRRPGRLLAGAAGIAVAVALLASLGAFLAHSQATMTDRAVRGVGIDWQIQVQPGTDPTALTDTVHGSAGVAASAVVGFGTSSGLSATTGGSTQTTGPAVVLGVPADYRALFPTEVRTLAGVDSGVLLAQQTAATLHAAPGDTISVGRAGLPPVTVTVAGVVDLPRADTLFQKIGAPIGAQPVAPPDNVLILPTEAWQQAFDPLAAAGPDLVSTQIHAQLDHRLPADPAAAYAAVTAAAHNVEAATAGGGIVGNNLGVALDAARADAAYARLLFGFLGLPGAVLAALLSATVASSGATRRRTEQALLRARGASAAQLVRLAGAEAAVTGLTGAVIGLAGAAVVGQIAFSTASFGTTAATAIGWAAASAVIGLGIAAATILLPARRDLREATVTSGRATVADLGYPAWARYGLDVVLLVAAGLVFTATSSGDYQLVLAPEGVPTIAVSYWALAGPALLWIGAGLLTWRVADLLLGRGRPALRRALHPLTGALAGPVAAGMSRERRPLTRAIVLLALAIAFAASTATFNATYAQQAEADAQLTNGADVTITPAPGTPAPAGQLDAIAALPGVRAVEPVQHRFAYIGTDLQDLYGVRPATITAATALQDTYFSGGTAAALMTTLASQPDSILVSAETVKDYQLQVGDTVNLRLVDALTNQLTTVPFHYVGVVSEFPTAPKDSFFVANAAYITARTGNDAAGAFLVDTGGQHTTAVAQQARTLLGPTATVTDITTTRQTIGSSLLVPHVGHQHRPGDRRPRFGHHPDQQVELLGPQFDLHAAQAHPAGGPIDLQRTDPDHGRPRRHHRGGGPAAQVRLHPGQQLREPERFGQVVVRAGLQPHHHVDLLVPGGQHHQHTAGLHHPQPPAHLDAVQVRQPQIQQRQIERLLRGGGQRGGTGHHPPGGMAVHPQARGQGPADRLVVLDHQQLSHPSTLATRTGHIPWSDSPLQEPVTSI